MKLFRMALVSSLMAAASIGLARAEDAKVIRIGVTADHMPIF